MDSAGKRITKQPDRLINNILQPNIIMSSENTPTTSTLTTVSNALSTKTPVSQSGSSGNYLQNSSKNDVGQRSLQDMMMNMIEETKKLSVSLNARADQTDVRLEEIRLLNANSFAQCLERNQLLDMRITKLEDDNVQQTSNITHQDAVNTQMSSRVNYLEEEVVSIRRDITRLVTQNRVPANANNDLSQILPTVSLSSTRAGPYVATSVPLATTSHIFQSPSMIHTQAPSGVYDSSKSSFFGTQERLQDAVSEFSGSNKNMHPETFLCQLNAYFENVPLSPAQQLISAQRRIGGDARIWYESLIPSPETYSEFCILFRQRFWSAATQRKVRNDIFRPFQYHSATGITTHAMSWIAKSKYLSPPLDQCDLVGVIIQHYPFTLGMAIRGRGPTTTNELLAILTEFEESTSFCDRPNYSRRDEVPPTYENNQNRPRQFNERRGNHNQQNRNGYRGGHNGGSPTVNPNNNHVGAPISQLDVSGNVNEDRT